MKKVYGYIRVSTAKQGEGVSLIVQKDAISRYAEKYNLEIIQWFEEKETAAKQGRPLFTKMMNLLKERKATGVVIHKIDRGARNLKDWADLGNLIDQGIEVHFAHESLDLQARGGRLSADIQAVIAADYIRNLRQEAIKGLYGRLKQGIYPFNAPIGYLNTGKGKPKAIDPIRGPLVRKVFELYATRNYSITALSEHIATLGLTNSGGRKPAKNCIWEILKNPFYIGILKVKGVTFNGVHKSIISPKLFNRVQLILHGRESSKEKHDFLFRKLLKCSLCGFSLSGEKQKGRVYYRCHTKGCLTKGIRESQIEAYILKIFRFIKMPEQEAKEINEEIEHIEKNWKVEKEEILKGIDLQVAQLQVKLERLTDCYVEGGIDKEMFENRKSKLLIDLKEKEEAKAKLQQEDCSVLNVLRQFLELVKSLTDTYQMGILEEKRQLIEMVTSNLVVSEKKLMISMRSPFNELINRCDFSFGGHLRDRVRTMTCDCEQGSQPLVFADETSNIKHEPLTREQLKLLLQVLIDKAKEFPKLPREIERIDDS